MIFRLFILMLMGFFFAATANAKTATCPRIISQSPYITEMLDYLGLGDCIVGVSRYSQRDLPRTGGILDPNAAAIDALMADIFITSDWATLATLKKVVPKETRILRLASFNTMGQLEQNMREIVAITGRKAAIPKITAFANAWRKKVTQVQGNHKKVLLLSACSGTAYSFGPNSRLYDLFSRAGFQVVETQAKIRHIRPGMEIETLTALVEQYQPDLLFVFERRLTKQCQLIIPKIPVRILTFDGRQFLNPSVAILSGLDVLIKKQKAWQNIGQSKKDQSLLNSNASDI